MEDDIEATGAEHKKSLIEKYLTKIFLLKTGVLFDYVLVCRDFEAALKMRIP